MGIAGTGDSAPTIIFRLTITWQAASGHVGGRAAWGGLEARVSTNVAQM